MYAYLIWKCTVLKHTWLFSNVSNDQSFPIFFLIAIRYCVELTIILIFTIDTTSPTVLLVWTIPFTFQKRSWGIGIVLMAEQKLLQYISFATTTTFSFFWANKIRRVSYNDTLLSGPTIKIHEHNMFLIRNSSLTHQVLLLVQTRVEFITTGDYFESRGASHVSISVATVVIIILYPYTVTIFWTCIFSEMQRIVHNTIERASRYWRTAEFFNNFVVICKFKVYKKYAISNISLHTTNTAVL